jgi:hypothetical protein
MRHCGLCDADGRVLMMRKCGNFWVVRSIIITKDELIICIHIVITILPSLYNFFLPTEKLKEGQA